METDPAVMGGDNSNLYQARGTSCPNRKGDFESRGGEKGLQGTEGYIQVAKDGNRGRGKES